jgi:amino acid transporter
MGQKGALHSLLGEAHTSNKTPHRAVAVSGVATLLPLGVMIVTGVSPFDVYGLLGTLATFGFLTAYMLVSVAAPIFLRNEGRLTSRDVFVSALALMAMGLALVGNVYPAPPAPYAFLPYIYLGLLVFGLSWSMVMNSRFVAAGESPGRNSAGNAAIAE